MKTEVERMTVTSAELREVLGCGRRAAYKIGMDAGARIKIGSRVLWNVTKIREYLNQKSEGAKDEAGL